MRRLPLAGVAAAIALGACASGGAAGAGGAAQGLQYGYMIPGNDVAAALGVRATDTIPELPASTTVPTALANAISQEVNQGRWNNRCTRRFGGPTVYALIFYRACDASLGPEAEPVVVVGFGPDGRVVGRVPWSGPSTVSLLVPARRF
jgi:hypothetical protein